MVMLKSQPAIDPHYSTALGHLYSNCIIVPIIGSIARDINIMIMFNYYQIW